MTGLEAMNAIVAGDAPAPPIAELVGFDLAEVGEGRASFALDPGERHYNPLGTVHGGIVRAITEATGRVVARGSVIHRGGRVATAEARLTDEDGRLLAHATSTCLIMAA
jgi:acyl-coenzyme A thioesterase PaaI-like protein